MNMDNNLQKYQAFVKTVETGSFTHAARLLNYAQSSVSKMIADLEKEWGVTLLERSRSGVQLTACGEQILPYAHALLEDYQKLSGFVDEMNGVRSGTVRIGTFSSAAIHWLPNIVAAFQKDYPDIGYELLLGDYEEVERWLEEGRIECGFLRLPTRPEFETIFLKQDEYKVVLPKGHPLTECAVIEPHALDGQPFLLLEHGGRTEVSDLLTQFGIHPDIRFTTWEDYAILSMAEKGLGIGILPQMILQRIPYEVEIRPLSAPYYRRIGLAMKNRVRLSPAAKKFLEYLPFREAGADR